MSSYKHQLLQSGRETGRAGFTLIEMIVSISIIILMGTLAIFGLSKTLTAQSESAAKIAIRSMLARAQAYAITNQRSAGIRFQFAPNSDPTDEDWQEGTQYLVLIEKMGTSPVLIPNSSGSPSSFGEYTAVPDVQPVPLPGSIGVFAVSATDPLIASDANRMLDSDLGSFFFTGNENQAGLMDATTFSIVFSRTGQLVRRKIAVRPRPATPTFTDTVFNHAYRVLLDQTDQAIMSSLNNTSTSLLFYDGRYRSGNPYFHPSPEWEPGAFSSPLSDSEYNTFRPWCEGEASEMGFYIFAKSAMRDAPAGSRYTDYVENTLTPIYVNMYTGELLEEDFQ